MALSVTEDKIDDIFLRLETALADAHAAKRRYLIHKLDLEQAVGQALLEGHITGKNAAVREAACREFFAEDYRELAALEDEMAARDYLLALEKNQLDWLKLRLRLIEAQAVFFSAGPTGTTGPAPVKASEKTKV